MKLYVPSFHIISVPSPMYEKGTYIVVINVGSGLPFELYINNILAVSGTGTGATQPVSVLISNSMISLSPVEVRLQGLRTKTTTATCWGPSLITSILTQHDDQGAYTAGVGWAPTISANTLAAAAPTSPTTGSKNGRRTIICNGTDQFCKATFTRNQPSETWVAGQWIGNVVSGNKTMVSGASSAGQLYRTLTDTNISLYSGAALTFAAGTSVEDVWLVLGALFSGASSNIYLGTTALGPGSAGIAPPGGLTVGQSGSATNYARCEVGEVITTSAETSAGEKTHIVGYLKKVWGIS